MKWATRISNDTNSNLSNFEVSGGTFSFMDHGVFFDHGGGTGNTTGVYIHGITMHDMANWDDVGGACGTPCNHHDYIHTSIDAGSGTVSGVNAYNNYAYGDPGINCNAFYYSFPNAGMSAENVFNNIFVIGSTTNACANGFVT